jgi:sterol desaturase/sphingolipid hydroxylase (fatty acid hydroxylase superfamily)
MPTPIDLIIDPISIAILALYALLMIWEYAAPAKQLPRINGWAIRGLGAFAVYFYIASYLPFLWDEYLTQFQLMDLSGLGSVGGALVGIVIYEFGLYLWHRSMHKFDFLWSVFHQMHHSAERHDTFGAYYFSVMDMIGFTFLGSLSFSLIAGFDPSAITLILLITNFMAIFQHANIKTPVWLGYIIQRPESHSVHHAKGIHRYNYSDLPIFDIIFGTFKNPDLHENETGFYTGASKRIIDMMLFKDVTKPKAAAEN